MRLLPLILAIFALAEFHQIRAQGGTRNHHWHFGDAWTLNFHNSPPTHTKTSAILQFEGCASISDDEGNLLFYTNGITVWDRNNIAMPNGNGLLGDQGSTMSGIITPVIGHRDKYYLFTVDGPTTNPFNGPQGLWDGLHYNVVNMRANGGMGDVLPGMKNINLVDSTTEKVIALPGTHNREYWVVTQIWNKSLYYAYKVDCNGINTTPVISNVGLPFTGISYGYMKPDPTGLRIASIVTDTAFFGLPERVELLDFDPATGLLSNPRPVSNTASNFYGLEFSPDGNSLYVGNFANRIIYSYDLTATNIPASQLTVHNYGFLNFDVGALQLGPNDKIYIKRVTDLDVINNPNNRNAPNFQLGAIPLIPPYNNLPIGLPTFFDVWMPPLALPDTVVCQGDSTSIGRDPLSGFTYNWSPGNLLNDSTVANPVATPLVTTTFTVIATNGPCQDTATVRVRVILDSLSLTTSPNDSLWCPSQPRTITVSGGMTVVQWLRNGQNIGGAPSRTISTASGHGTYSVVVNDSCGNPDTVQLTLKIEPPTALINATGQPIICPGGTIPIAGSGGTIVLWRKDGNIIPGAMGNLIIGQGPGTYEVVVANACGLRDSATLVVAAAPLPVISFSQPDTTILCPGDQIGLSASGGTVVAWRRNGTVIPGTTDTTIMVATPGYYEVVMRNSFNCRDTAGVLVVLAAMPPIMILNTDTTVCTGEPVQLRTPLSGALTWAPGATLSCTSCPDPLATPLVTTTYTLGYIDTSGCYFSDTVQVSVSPLPAVDAGPDQSLCAGDTMQLSAAGALVYQWTPSAGLECDTCATTPAYPSGSTTYMVQGWSAFGCLASDTVRITVLAAPAISASGADTVCLGDTIALQSSGATSYVWSPAIGLSCTACPAPMASPQAPVVYTVTGTAANGCSGTATVNVTILSAAALQLTPDTVLCEGTGITLTVASPDPLVQYQWLPGTGLSCTACPSPLAEPLQTTTYTFSGTTARGCIVQDSFTLTVVAYPVLSLSGPGTVCQGTVATLSASGASTYQWLPTAGLSCSSCPSPSLVAQSTTTYTVTAADNNGCSVSDTITLQVAPYPALQVSAGGPICPGDTTIIVASGGSQYQWQPSPWLSCLTCPDPLTFPATTTTFTVTATGGNGCQRSDSVTVDVRQQPNISIAGSNTVCTGDTTFVSASGAQSYSWEPAVFASCPGCPATQLWPLATTTFTLNSIDAFGCEWATPYTVSVRPAPSLQVTPSSPVICEGDTVILQASGASQYMWQPPTGLSCTTCPAPLASPASSVTYTVVGTDTFGCVAEAYAIVDVQAAPEPGLPTDTTVCTGETLILTASGGVNYQWSSSLGLSCTNCSSPSLVALQSGQVHVTVTNQAGCSASATTNISLYPLPQVSAWPDTIVCAGLPVLLQASGGLLYSWSPAQSLSDPNAASTIALPLAITTYTVSGTDGNGCIGMATVTIETRQGPLADAGPDLILFSGQSGELQGSGGITALWWPPSGLSDPDVYRPTVTPINDSVYYLLTVWDDTGCPGFDSVLVVRINPERPIFPNAFSPNGDGNNDMFTIGNLQYYELDWLRVFNRWGELVYETFDPANGWDGNMGGVPQPIGTYVYRAQLRSPYGGQIHLQGNVTLLR